MVRADGDRVQVEAVPVRGRDRRTTPYCSGPEGAGGDGLGRDRGPPRCEVGTAFENKFGNLGGQGVYAGVRAAALVDMVGGMRPGQVLVVTSSDGYAQEFACENVYPSAQWLSMQGEMLLAYEKDGATHPAWGEGPRIGCTRRWCIPQLSCAATSAAGQGWNVYESAGALGALR